jgi:hypothetical protein
MNGKGKNR